MKLKAFATAQFCRLAILYDEGAMVGESVCKKVIIGKL